MKTISFLGLRLDALTIDESVDACERLIAERGHQHVVLNASKTVLATDDPQLATIINRCALVNADGQSVVLGARFLGKAIPERVAGIDLMRRLLDIAPGRNWRVYLLGAHQETIEQVNQLLVDEGVNVVGHRNGYWNTQQEDEVVEAIAETAPDLLFVAMPSPRKELFLEKHLDRLNTGLAFGVGGSFDVMAGKTRRAPRWMQKVGLEWFFRFLQEPRRMFKRYLIGNLRFVQLILKQKSRQRRHHPEM